VADSEEPIGVTEIAARAGLDYATAYRFVTTLAELGYVERDDRKHYRPSIATVRLASTSLRNNALHTTALPVMRELRQRTGETVHLTTCIDFEMMLLATCESEQLLGMRPNRWGRYPIHCTASGKMMLAGMKQRELAEFLTRAPLSSCTKNTIVNRSQFAREI